jgi:hypothetical protein
MHLFYNFRANDELLLKQQETRVILVYAAIISVTCDSNALLLSELIDTLKTDLIGSDNYAELINF